MSAAAALSCPAPLAQVGFTLLGATPADEPALRALYIEHRREEFAPLGLPEAQVHSLLETQFALQMRGYAQTYEACEVLVLRKEMEIVGRLILGEAEGTLRILDLLIVADWRGRGIGGALVAALLAQAGRPVSLHVAKGNPARNLYERLGFRVTGSNGVALAMAWSPDSP